MFRTTVMISQALRLQVNRYAKKHGMSMGQVIRMSLETMINQEENVKVDPFFADKHFLSLGKEAQNFSTSHDDIIYGDAE